MKIAEEFKIKNTAGHELVLQKVTSGISYLDFGNAHLPRNFEGYLVKHTDDVAEPHSDGSFTVQKEVYRRM